MPSTSVWRSTLAHSEVQGLAAGLKLDVEGNLYVAGNTQEEMWVFNTRGRLIGW